MTLHIDVMMMVNSNAPKGERCIATMVDGSMTTTRGATPASALRTLLEVICEAYPGFDVQTHLVAPPRDWWA